jgi:acyl-homoserine lactone synthase
MIHVISADNRYLYEDAIEQHFRIRHDIFVKERGWMTLDRRDGREVDTYDNIDTVYLLAMEGESIVGGHRLYPTIKPTMVEEVFPHLAAVRGAPSDLTIFEWSRFFVVKERRGGRVNFELMAALQEVCLDEGISHVTAVMETWWLPRFQEAGFTVHPLGLPAVVEQSWTMAGLIEISSETLDHVRRLGDINGSVLVRRGPQHSIIDRARTAYRLATANAL